MTLVAPPSPSSSPAAAGSAPSGAPVAAPTAAKAVDHIERIGRIVRERGNVELLLRLDRIVDFETEVERSAALGSVIKELAATKKK